MFEVMVEESFASAHRLLNYEGVCENVHGHNWKVQVYVTGSELDEAGILIDYKLLYTSLKDILDTLDHVDINDLEPFKGLSPSSENIARYIYKTLKQTISGTSEVTVWETDKRCASYWE